MDVAAGHSYRRFAHSTTSLLAVSTWALTACGSNSIHFGAVAFNSSEAVVAGLAIEGYRDVGSIGPYNCTGTLIAPNKVLTAAHCVYPDGPSPFQASSFFSTLYVFAQTSTTTDINAPPLDRTSRQSISIDVLNPNWSPNDDLAIITLQSDLPGPYTILGTSIPTAGQQVNLVGFGKTETYSASGVKRQALATVINPDTAGMVSYGSTTSGSCYGDSGGPVFFEYPATELFEPDYVQVAVVQGGEGLSSGLCGIYSRAKTVSSASTWLSQFAPVTGFSGRRLRTYLIAAILF
jgi:secreted trypsin-like serine protease